MKKYIKPTMAETVCVMESYMLSESSDPNLLLYQEEGTGPSYIRERRSNWGDIWNED